jgi:predicted nucleic acid-binding protein
MKARPIVLDSSAWIEYILDGPNAPHYAKTLKAPPDRIIVPSVCIFEVYRSIERIVSVKEALAVTMSMQLFRVDPLSTDRAREAATISRQHSLSTADAIIYATTLAHDAELLTQDADFMKLPSVRYFKHIR